MPLGGALPEIVANGRKPGVFACGSCHRATGPGGPENADLAGLPKCSISQQMADYKCGARGTALPGRTPPKLMVELSKPITDWRNRIRGDLLFSSSSVHPRPSQMGNGFGTRLRRRE